jgi:glycosyltransferase involved in cell wall biosynthesis
LPAPSSPVLSVVMPCLNEAEGIEQSIRAAREGMALLQVDGEIVVVDNGSTDGSDRLARAAGARVVREARRGYGAALRTGFRASRGAIIVMGDGDCSYDFAAISGLVTPILEGRADLVIGNRLQPGLAPNAMPWLHRVIGTPVLSMILRALFGLRVSDSQCGLRAFRAAALPADGFASTGMEFASEMLIRCARDRLTVLEVPIAYHVRAGSSKLRTVSDGLRHLRLILLYSPTLTLQIPGFVLLALGVFVVAVLGSGPKDFAGRMWDFNSLLFGSLATILGYSLVLFDMLAKVYSVSAGFRRDDPWLHRLTRFFSLDTGVAAGAVVFLVGAGIAAATVISWLAHGAGVLMAVREIAVGLTSMVVGALTVGTSFLVSLLEIDRRRGLPDE